MPLCYSRCGCSCVVVGVVGNLLMLFDCPFCLNNGFVCLSVFGLLFLCMFVLSCLCFLLVDVVLCVFLMLVVALFFYVWFTVCFVGMLRCQCVARVCVWLLCVADV